MESRLFVPATTRRIKILATLLSGLLNHHRNEVRGGGRTMILFNFASIQDLQRSLDMEALATGQVAVQTQLVPLAELERQLAGRGEEADDAWDIAMHNTRSYNTADHVSVAIMTGTFVKPSLICCVVFVHIHFPFIAAMRSFVILMSIAVRLFVKPWFALIFRAAS